ncbi:MAG: glycoside hydrolase family 5 protein, partial [Anaerolineales bacterium]|nr:glycoside hydrolase family 5 protein [Anaerolineales bacterium]
MRPILSSLLILILTACAAPPLAPTATPQPTATPMPPTQTPAPTLEPAVDAFTMNQQLARTVNLGNALEAPNEGDWGMTLQAEYFQLIKQAGFTAVRVPIRWSAHAEASAPYTIDPAFFERIDWVIAQARQNDLTVLINMHHYEEMATDPRNHQARFVALWKQIAERYQNQPQAVLFELMNEPNGQLTASLWNKVMAETLPVVRTSNPNRNLVLGPAEWNNLRALKE